MRRWVLICLMLAAACQPPPAPESPPSPTPPMNTSWGITSALTWTATFDSPPLFTRSGEFVTAAFERDANTMALTIYRTGSRTRTNITAHQPYGLTLFPGGADGVVALWLDDDGSGIQRLFVAYVDDTGFSERESTPVSSGAVTRYAAAVTPDGSIWTVWSTPNAGESTLIGSRLDSSGRARTPQVLRGDADFPALVVTNAGNVLLYWLESGGRDLYRGELIQSGLTLTARLAAAPWPSTPADQLISLKAGLDNTHAYLFWQTLAASGLHEVWYTSGALSATAMRGARRLRVNTADQTAQTGFNHGTAYAALAPTDGPALEWVSPASGQNQTLPVATFAANALGILYLRDGDIFAAQTVGTLPHGLIAPPQIAVDDQRDLILAWWLPDTPQEAVLYLVESGR